MSHNLAALQRRRLGEEDSLLDVLSRRRDGQGFLGHADLATLALRHNLPSALVRSVAQGYE
ncbi:MAG: hypothetical protein H7831_17205, partial [Magnetococcus sp. WYHC-3]